MKNNLSRIQQKAFIYWLANNNNTLTFSKVNTGTYECILNDGEYFFYTNEAKTDLLTLGPGTRLTYYPSSIEIDPLDDSTILWALNDSESITKDDVAENGIGARKYFYPLTNTFDCFHGKYDVNQTPIALHISKRVLTLPLYADLTLKDVDRICDVILKCRK